MGKWRDAWTKFKKAHPDFEKSKKFKNDVGPLMDEYEKGCAKCEAAFVAAVKSLNDLDKTGQSLLYAFKGYKAVMDEMAAYDRRILGDYQSVLEVCAGFQRPILLCMTPLYTMKGLTDFT
jgi:hypothetical protein